MKSRREFVKQATQGVVGFGLASLSVPHSSRAASDRMRTGLVYDERYLQHVLPPRRGNPHPESPLRLTRMIEALEAAGLMKETRRIEPLADARPSIEAHHTPEHVSSIRQLDLTGPVAELAVAGALGAVRAVAERKVQNAFCAIRPPGHHANNTGTEEGFCFYSNAAIAARYAQSLGFERVLVIDWDYHHGNATQNAFYEDASVLFFSTHDWQAYPGTGDPAQTGAGEGAGLNINVHLDCGTRDAEMLNAWDRKLLPAAARFRPDFVIISAGFDSRKEDLLGCFEVTDDAFRRMTRTAMDVARDYCGGRVVSLLEGGYNVDGLARAAVAHVGALSDGD